MTSSLTPRFLGLLYLLSSVAVVDALTSSLTPRFLGLLSLLSSVSVVASGAVGGFPRGVEGARRLGLSGRRMVFDAAQ